MREGETFMGLLDAGAEEPKSKALRYVISGVALVLLLGLAGWYFLRYTTEKRTVERFMHAIVTGDTQQAYQVWHPHPNFSYQDFLSFWGPSGYYSPIKSYRIESAEVPPKGGSGVVIVVEISGYDPFPKPEETVKFAQNREVQLWIERSDQSMSFPPP
ncbi:MAG TPA: hypothetical protein VGT24_07080 [Candidatus Acidoferrales bacterium]|nr:hypothetical protein [Candidatus Acidoferrales bacterium]